MCYFRLAMSNKIAPWDLDIRVRERNLVNGRLEDKDVEKLLGSLPDLASDTVPFATSQPALQGHDRSD
jgi:hypothetical protein